MKCRLEKSFGAYDAGPDFRVKLKPLMFGFQDVTAAHSQVSGCGMEWLLAQKKAWVMHRFCLHFFQRPKLGEDLTFVTWHKGSRGYRAYRDYEIWCGSERRVSAASLWLFVDLEKNKILKVPQESSQWYTVETQNALDVDMDVFKPSTKLWCQAPEPMTLRTSDLDPIGHVNNGVYLDLLETGVDRYFDGKQTLGKVMIQFNKEITRETARVQVVIKEDRDHFKFNVVSDASIHAFGEFGIETAS